MENTDYPKYADGREATDEVIDEILQRQLEFKYFKKYLDMTPEKKKMFIAEVRRKLVIMGVF